MLKLQFKKKKNLQKAETFRSLILKKLVQALNYSLFKKNCIKIIHTKKLGQHF